MIVERASYSLELEPSGLRATLRSPQGEHWLTLSLLAAFDRRDGVDETLTVSAPVVDGATIAVERTSTIWERAGVQLVCGEDAIELRAWVEGAGSLTDLHLLGGRSLLPGLANGFYPTGTSFRTLFSPNPGDPARLVRRASEPAVIGVSGDGALGRGHWFFTPAPLCLAFATEDVDDPEEAVAGGWLSLAVAAPVSELGFVQLAYQPADRAFHLLLDYEGHTEASGRFDAPALVLTPGCETPYAALRTHRDDLAGRGAAPSVSRRDVPAWWREPMFCGWGAQCGLSAEGGGPAPSLATQANYDAFLATLAGEGLIPGTVVIDDKWQEAYGTNTVDRSKWPDLPGWIDQRRQTRQHVLLWWKAWDAEGLPEELCIRTPEGTPAGLDPTNPEARSVLHDAIAHMLGPDGIDADGLKIDFTARTPSGQALEAHGRGWGIALLHELLSVVYAAAKEVKPDALVITHTPHPSFADVTDMVRLNDMLRLDDPGLLPVDSVVPQMRFRGRVASAALPDVLVDTDDWCVPDKRTWREYLELKPQLGVPSLYYATHLDWSGERLDETDYAALRGVWAEWRARG